MLARCALRLYSKAEKLQERRGQRKRRRSVRSLQFRSVSNRDIRSVRSTPFEQTIISCASGLLSMLQSTTGSLSENAGSEARTAGIDCYCRLFSVESDMKNWAHQRVDFRDRFPQPKSPRKDTHERKWWREVSENFRDSPGGWPCELVSIVSTVVLFRNPGDDKLPRNDVLRVALERGLAFSSSIS